MPNKFSQKIEVRFFDIDVNNHVNNSVYFTYMENARAGLLLEDYLKWKEQSVNFVVAEACCKYRRPIQFTDEVEVELIFDFSKNVSFEIKYLFKNPDDVIYAEGHTIMACVDLESNRPVRIPKELREKYDQ